jgi:hypothetical protein
VAKRGAEALIPTKKNRTVQKVVDKAVYTLRNRIERMINRLKNSRRVASRFDKLIESFAAFRAARRNPPLVQVPPHSLEYDHFLGHILSNPRRVARALRHFLNSFTSWLIERNFASPPLDLMPVGSRRC